MHALSLSLSLSNSLSLSPSPSPIIKLTESVVPDLGVAHVVVGREADGRAVRLLVLEVLEVLSFFLLSVHRRPSPDQNSAPFRCL